jgi:hypothetical protein
MKKIIIPNVRGRLPTAPFPPRAEMPSYVQRACRCQDVYPARSNRGFADGTGQDCCPPVTERRIRSTIRSASSSLIS